MYLLSPKTKFLFVLVAITALHVSCNSNETKADKMVEPPINDTPAVTENKASDKAATCEYYITENDGRAMIQNFTSTYPSLVGSRPGHILTNEFWIDSCVLSSLVNFFKTTGSGCDGVRFHFIGDKKSQLIIVPTSAVTPPSPTFQHTDRWDIKITGSCSTPLLSQMSKDDARTSKNEFGESFRQEDAGGGMSTAKIDRLSASVWYGKCVIEALARLVLDKAKNLNGVTAFCAAHLKMETDALGLGQKYDNQSTLIFVPTRESDHKPAWDVVTPPASLDSSSYKNTSGAFNHGQLCPQICD